MDRNGRNSLRFLHQLGIILKLNLTQGRSLPTAARYTRFSITSKRAPTSLTGSLRTAAGAYPFTQPSHGRSNSAPDLQDFGCRTTSRVSVGLWQRYCTVNTFDTFDFSLLFLSQTDSLICFGTHSMESNVKGFFLNSIKNHQELIQDAVCCHVFTVPCCDHMTLTPITSLIQALTLDLYDSI